MKQRKELYNITSYLKLFQKVNVDKIAQLLNLEKEEFLKKLKILQEKEEFMQSKINFSMKDNVIFVTKKVTSDDYSDIFKKEISYFQELNQKLVK